MQISPASPSPDEAVGGITSDANGGVEIGVEAAAEAVVAKEDGILGGLFKGLSLSPSTETREDLEVSQSNVEEEEEEEQTEETLNNGTTPPSSPLTIEAHEEVVSANDNEQNEESDYDVIDNDDDGHDEEVAEQEVETSQSSSTKSEGSGVLVEKEDIDATTVTAVTNNDAATTTADMDVGDENAVIAKTPTSNDHIENGMDQDDDQPQQQDEITSTSLVANTNTNTNTAMNSKQVEHQKPTITCFIHASTPIPNSDSSLRILRKFVNKASIHFPTSLGGTKPSSILNYLFGGGVHGVDYRTDECCLIYKELIDILSADSVHDDDDHDDHDIEEEEIMIESILGHSGDTMSKARSAMATFCRLVEIWSLESLRMRIVDTGDDISEFTTNLKKSPFYALRNHIINDEETLLSTSSMVTSELMTVVFTCAEALVAHGCFDNVMIGAGEEKKTTNSSNFDLTVMPSISEDADVLNDSLESLEGEKTIFVSAVTVLADSIFYCHLDTDETELTGLKFLLTTGCRTTTNVENGHEEAMLRGSRLLQMIRVCYRVYLSTQSEANKTTARAALRQIVTSTFKRLDNSNKDDAVQTTTAKSVIVGKDGDDPFCPPLMDSNEEISKNDDRSTAEMSYGGNFASFENKDAYLVLRSLCKLSMKATVGGAFQNVVVLRDESLRSSESTSAAAASRNTNAYLRKQEMLIDPALDSKILALDLLVEILQGTKTEILLNAGPQLIYAVRNYLCQSLLKNCTSDNNFVVSLSLRLFVPLIRHFRSHLKTEIEAFVTNVFFVILDSKNSAVEHKLRVVILFEEICSDSTTLAEIFLNYDCDLSAVDLFQRIVNTLAKVAKIGLHDKGMNSSGIFVAGAGVSRAEKSRQDHRELRLEAMKAVKQVLSSLHESFITPMNKELDTIVDVSKKEDLMQDYEHSTEKEESTIKIDEESTPNKAAGTPRQSLVQIYDSKKKRREEATKAVLKFNQKPSAGIKFASEVGLINGDDPADVAQYLLSNKDVLDKTQIGEYLGREPEYQGGFPLKVLHQYLSLLDFTGLLFDDAIKFYLSGFRLPGEAQKVSSFLRFAMPMTMSFTNHVHFRKYEDRSNHGEICRTIYNSKF
jgi:hypothetical protein